MQHQVLLDHIRRLREFPELRYAKLVFGLECNLGFEDQVCSMLPRHHALCLIPAAPFRVQHAIHTLQRNNVKEWVTLSEGPNGTPGILTTNQSKEIMNTAVTELLVSNRLVIWKSMVSVSMGMDDIIKDLITEMRQFMVIVQEPNSLFGKSRRTFTGKSGGETDDLIIALQLSVLTMQLFTRESKYLRFHP